MPLGVYPSRKLNPLLPHPEPSVKWVNTHLALCFSGVSVSNEMQIATDASTLYHVNAFVPEVYLGQVTICRRKPEDNLVQHSGP